MTKNPPRRRAQPATEERKRALNAGLRKIYAPPSDDRFDDLLRRIARAKTS